MQVAVQDSSGNTVTNATNSITIAIGANPSSGTLSGTTTVSAVSGVATFPNLGIDIAGNGYTLQASASGLTGATSSTFNITAPAPCTPPAGEVWTVSVSCTFQGSANADDNVIVEAGITLTIDAGAALNIDFSSFHLLIKDGAKVVTKNGGKIF